MSIDRQLAEWRAKGVDFTVGPACEVIDEMERPLSKREGVVESLPWPAVVPMPPSLSRLFTNLHRKGKPTIRTKTPEYRKWVETVVPMLRPYARPLSYPVTVEYVVRDKMHGGSDIGNLTKALTDALVKAGVLHNDSVKYLRKESIEYAPGGVGVAITVLE